jgi:uncharacterized protein DUF3800
MQLFFIDESGTIPPKNKNDGIDYFTLGGIIIPEDLWHELDKELANLKTRFDINGEIKWRYFSPQKTGAAPHPLSHLSGSQKEELRLHIYQLITKFKSIRLICALVDVKAAYALDYVANDNDLYWYAYKQMTERFQYYLQDISRIVGSKINGIIVCDHRQPKDDHQLRHLHQKLLTGSKKHFSVYENLIEGVFIAPSHLSVGIQFADMVAGAVYRNFVRKDARYFDLIKASFRKGAAGQVEGYGLVRWPKRS